MPVICDIFASAFVLMYQCSTTHAPRRLRAALAWGVMKTSLCDVECQLFILFSCSLSFIFVYEICAVSTARTTVHMAGCLQSLSRVIRRAIVTVARGYSSAAQAKLLSTPLAGPCRNYVRRTLRVFQLTFLLGAAVVLAMIFAPLPNLR